MSFVGRERELERLRAAAAQASEGTTRVLVIEGQAGIGKTALAERLVETACAGAKVHRHSFRGASLRGPMFELVRLGRELGAGEPPAEWTGFDEVFLLSKDGLLIHHGGASGSVDEDVLGSMLSAVQDFVRDSFGGGDGKGGLNELAYMGLQIIIEHGENVFAAGVVSRGAHPSMRDDVKRTISSIESEYGQKLAPWDGEITSLEKVPSMVTALVEARYPRLGLSDDEAVAHQNLRFEWLRSALAQEPGSLRVILLDDLQDADATSLKVLSYVLRGLGDMLTLFILANRPEECGRLHGEIIGGLVDDGHAERVALSPLDLAETKELLGSILKGAEVTDALAGEVRAATGGVPSEIHGLAPLLVKEGRIVAEGGIWAVRGRRADWWSKKAEAASKMLEDVDPDTLSLLEFCSVFAMRHRRDLLAKGLDWSPQKLDGRLDHARALGLVVERGDGGFGFRLPALEAALRDGMGEFRRTMWHRTAARVLLAEKGVAVPVFAAAEHMALGQVATPGIEYCLRAAELSEAEYAYPEAARYLGWAVGLAERRGDDARLPSVLGHLASVLHTDGDFPGEARALEKLMASDAIGPRELASAARRLGAAHQAMGEPKKARELYDRALACLADSAGDIERGRVLNGIGRLLTRDSPAEALKLDTDYLKMAEAVGSRKDAAQAQLSLGADRFHMKDVVEAVSHWLKASDSFAAVGDDFGLSDTLLNLGAAYNIKGDTAGSVEALERAVDIKQRIGDYGRMAAALHNLGTAYQRMGRDELAIETHRRCLEVRLRIGDNLGRAKSYGSLGIIYGQKGMHTESLENFEKELAILLRHGDAPRTAKAHANLSEAHLALGRYADAERHADMAITLSAEKGLMDEHVAALTSKARAVSRTGDWPRACESFEKALQLSMASGDPRRLAMTHLEYGEEQARNGEPGARRSLELALEMFDKAGAAPLAKRARTALDTVGK